MLMAGSGALCARMSAQCSFGEPWLPRAGTSRRRDCSFKPAHAPRKLIVCANKSDKDETVKKADDYSATFQEVTKTDLTYRHELGMNYNRITPNIIVGSCLQSPADVDCLKEKENVTTVCNLQEDCNMAYFNVDIEAIRKRAKDVGNFHHLRLPIRDMDGFDLRMRLPSVIATLKHELKNRDGTLYVHCTAGLGRAPAVALAYMYWVLGQDLDEAYKLLLSQRKCVPSMENIRAATCDLLTGCTKGTIDLHWRSGNYKSIEIAGMDVGWHARLALEYQKPFGYWSLEHYLPVGRYEYKYVIDKEKWTYNPHAPITKKDKRGNCNNHIEVVDKNPKNWVLRKHLMHEGAKLSQSQRQAIKRKLDAIGSELETIKN